MVIKDYKTKKYSNYLRPASPLTIKFSILSRLIQRLREGVFLQY
jgi:hypothetical protein